jgi:hypothetical protein
MWMDLRLQHGIARLFSKTPRDKQELPFNDVASLIREFPAIKDWKYLESDGDELVAFCTQSVEAVFQAREAYGQEQAAERLARRTRGAVVSGSSTETAVREA